MDAGNNKTRGNRLQYRNPEKCGPKRKIQQNKTIMNLYSPLLSHIYFKVRLIY